MGTATSAGGSGAKITGTFTDIATSGVMSSLSIYVGCAAPQTAANAANPGGWGGASGGSVPGPNNGVRGGRGGGGSSEIRRNGLRTVVAAGGAGVGTFRRDSAARCFCLRVVLRSSALVLAMTNCRWYFNRYVRVVYSTNIFIC